jgi:DNA-binding transcriptional MocR family regulator
LLQSFVLQVVESGEHGMNGLQSDAISHYLAWAKLHSNARFNLAASGVLDYPLAELPVQIEDLEIGGTGPYGYQPLMERLATKAGVPKECIVYTLGTSMANFVALTALVHRGDEVLIERPTYDPLLTILDHIGAKVRRFERLAEKGFKLGLGEFERKLTAQTRLVILCNLHNPSSTFIDESTMRQAGDMASKVG